MTSEHAAAEAADMEKLARRMLYSPELSAWKAHTSDTYDPVKAGELLLTVAKLAAKQGAWYANAHPGSVNDDRPMTASEARAMRSQWAEQPTT